MNSIKSKCFRIIVCAALLCVVLSGSVGVYAGCPHRHAEVYKHDHATCTKNGTYYYQCKDCGEKFTKTEAKLGHDHCIYSGHKKPTCTQDGYTDYKCERCDDVHRSTVKKLGHNYKRERIVVQPTCVREGNELQKCTRCGATRNVSMPKTAHNYVSKIVNGEKKYYCKNCGQYK